MSLALQPLLAQVSPLFPLATALPFNRIHPSDPELQALMEPIVLTPAHSHHTAWAVALLSFGIPIVREVLRAVHAVGHRIASFLRGERVHDTPQAPHTKGRVLTALHAAAASINETTGWFELTLGVGRDLLTIPGIGLSLYLNPDRYTLLCYAPEAVAAFSLLMSTVRRARVWREVNALPGLPSWERLRLQTQALGIFSFLTSREAALRGRLHPALPVEGATRAPEG